MCETCANFIDRIHGSDDTKAARLESETQLELARIHKAEAIELAKISQKMNEDDNDAALVAAEVESEVQSDVIDNLTQPEQQTVVIPGNSPEMSEPEIPEEDTAEAPPEIDDVPAPAKSSGNWSYWG